MEKLRHPVVMIFGAGATRRAFAAQPVPPPVDTDFFELVAQLKRHGTPRLAKLVRRDVWSLYSRSTDVGLEAYYREIETRAAILRFAKSVNQPKDWQSRQENLEELIRRAYIHTTCNTTEIPTKPLPGKLHRTILSKLVPGDTIVTFNYDLLLEESFGNDVPWSPVDGYGVEVHGKTGDWCRPWLKARRTRKKSRISLLKLHGSINPNPSKT